jgi:hypothetical protein
MYGMIELYVLSILISKADREASHLSGATSSDSLIRLLWGCMDRDKRRRRRSQWLGDIVSHLVMV